MTAHRNSLILSLQNKRLNSADLHAEDAICRNERRYPYLLLCCVVYVTSSLPLHRPSPLDASKNSVMLVSGLLFLSQR